MGLCSLPATFLAWGNRVLESTGSMVGMVTSKRTYANTCLPELQLLVPLSPWQVTADPCLHRRPSNTQGRSGSVSCGITAPFPSVLVHTRFCAIQEFLISPVLWKFCNQTFLSFKVRFLGGSQPLWWIPRWGSLMWGLEPLQQWENCWYFFGIILQFVGCPLSRYGI